MCVHPKENYKGFGRIHFFFGEVFDSTPPPFKVLPRGIGGRRNLSMFSDQFLGLCVDEAQKIGMQCSTKRGTSCTCLK